MMKIILLFKFFAVFVALSGCSSHAFQPSLSSNCSTSLSVLSEALEPYTCGPIMRNVLHVPNNFTACTTGKDGVNCMDPGSVYAASQAAKDMVPVYRIANQSSCSLCTKNNGMISGCSSLLTTLVGVSYGNGVDYSTYGISNTTTIARINKLVTLGNQFCQNNGDQTSLQILKYQSEVLCQSSNTFNRPVTSTGTLPGVLDMRAIMQCGTCAVLPCLPGQLCDGSGPAIMCPVGYYCPTTAAKLTCPRGYFCPEGSTDPQTCRGIAATSCDMNNATREVVWVPLFLALFFLLTLYCYEPIKSIISKDKTMSTVKNSEGRKFAVVVAKEEDAMDFSTRTSEVSITFNDLVLVTNNTTRLNHVTGKIRPGKFTAIMGGSGAGKTTLMNVILGREAATSGEIAYLSQDYAGKIPSRILDRIVAFVPQNDVYLREMTVYELVEHSARWRSTISMSSQLISDRIEEVLTQLQLQHLRHVTVSNGLSPGDRKKVNIALELVTSPNILFLDEPTTGIDASSALNIARIIANLAKTGLTCVAVIHQPRAEIFGLIDDLIILSQGGRMAYQGSTKFVLSYFGQLGYTLPTSHTNKNNDDQDDNDAWLKINKTDFLIDITSKLPTTEALTKPSPYSKPSNITVTNDKKMETWADLWSRDELSFLQDCNDDEEELQRTSKRMELSKNKALISLTAPRQGIITQIQWFAYRGILQHFKQNAYWQDMIACLVGGIIMGIVSCGGPLYIPAIPFTYNGSCPPGGEVKCNTWIRFEVGPSTFYMSMLLGCVVIPSAVRTFGREKAVFLRESAVGANKLAYFVGKVCADLPFLVINTFLYMSPIIAIAPWRSPADSLYGLLLCLHLVVSSLGYWLSLLLDPDAAVFLGVILAILLNLFSGFVPTIGDGFIGQIMYTHWFARGLCVVELQQGQGITNEDDFNSVVSNEWKHPDLQHDCVSMIIIVIVLWGLSFAWIVYNNRRVGKF